MRAGMPNMSHVSLLFDLEDLCWGQKFENESVSGDALAVADGFPRNRSIKSEYFVELSFAQRHGRALVVTQFVELLRRKVVLCANIKQFKFFVLRKQRFHKLKLGASQNFRLSQFQRIDQFGNALIVELFWKTLISQHLLRVQIFQHNIKSGAALQFHLCRQKHKFFPRQRLQQFNLTRQ